MVCFCCVPGCSNNSRKKPQLSFFTLPLKRKDILKKWIHVIGRKNLPVNGNTRVCEEHFVNASRRLLRPDEVPTLGLPGSVKQNQPRKPPKNRTQLPPALTEPPGPASHENSCSDACVQTEDVPTVRESDLMEKVSSLQSVIVEKERMIAEQKFRLERIKNDDSQVSFYTRFQSYKALLAFFTFLGPAAECLCYSNVTVETKKKRRNLSIPPIEELFMTFIRLRLGLMEQDIVYRFSLSQSTVSRIITNWIYFLYFELKKIPLWASREVIQSNMPESFKKLYPKTRVIIDATEIYIDQPRLPDIKQMTFSNYKNSNTFKALVGISSDGVITFVSSLYPGSISDKELTRQSGILDLLNCGDSVMADRGFDIEDDLILRGVHLNMPPFLRGKKQFEENELIITRRIASLKIHVERAMERIKNFYIFDRSLPVHMTDVADRLFFVCCAFTNFHPPLCP